MNSSTVTIAELVSEAADDKKPKKTPPRMTQHDEADLEWFWCFGEATFERSTFGAVIERQSLYAEMTELCLTCDGYGTDPASGSRCVPCVGKGRTKLGLLEQGPRDVDCTKPCPECHTLAGYRRANADPELCLVCNGELYVETGAVGMAPAQQGEGGYEPDDGALRRYAKVSRRLSRLERQDRASAAVLQAYYGVDGLRWGGTDHGRLTALIPLTRAGAKLIDAEPNELGLGVRELFANLVADHARKKTPPRSGALMRATEEAGALYLTACKAWGLTEWGR